MLKQTVIVLLLEITASRTFKSPKNRLRVDELQEPTQMPVYVAFKKSVKI